jgi:hypothetical protein
MMDSDGEFFICRNSSTSVPQSLDSIQLAHIKEQDVSLPQSDNLIVNLQPKHNYTLLSIYTPWISSLSSPLSPPISPRARRPLPSMLTLAVAEADLAASSPKWPHERRVILTRLTTATQSDDLQ